jgi:hypothetical protein
MMCAMGGFGLAASLVGSLAWPVLVAGSVIFFRQPLKKLIGRLKSAQVAGQSFEFGPQLEEAEDRADVAVSDSDLIPSAAGVRPPSEITEEKALPISPDHDVSSGETSPSDASPGEASASPEYVRDPTLVLAERAEANVKRLSEEAEANPSFTVLRAWEILSSLLADYAETFLPERLKGRSPYALLPELQKLGKLSPSYVAAVQDLRRLRNAVAHGQHNPTPGEAIAYVETTGKLVFVGTFQLELQSEKQNGLS